MHSSVRTIPVPIKLDSRTIKVDSRPGLAGRLTGGSATFDDGEEGSTEAQISVDWGQLPPSGLLRARYEPWERISVVVESGHDGEIQDFDSATLACANRLGVAARCPRSHEADKDAIRMIFAFAKSLRQLARECSSHQVLAATVAALIGCSERPHDSPASTAAAQSQTAFDADFQTIASVELPQSGETAVIRISGADILGDSLLAVADPSEGHVVLVSVRSGAVRAIGRPGTGPGEFRVPVEPRFDSRGRLHVLDPGLRRIQVFDILTAASQRTISLQNMMTAVFDYDLLGDSLYVLAGELTGGQGAGIAIVDSMGQIRRTVAVPVPDRPAGTAASPLWASLGRVNIYASSRGFWITRPMFDSVWIVHAASDSQGVMPVPAPSFHTPQLPNAPPTSRADIASWWGTLLLPHTVLHSSTSLYVGFSRGTYNDGAPGVLMVLGPDSVWRSYDNAPPVLGLSDRTLIVTTSAGELPLKVALVREPRSTP